MFQALNSGVYYLVAVVLGGLCIRAICRAFRFGIVVKYIPHPWLHPLLARNCHLYNSFVHLNLIAGVFHASLILVYPEFKS